MSVISAWIRRYRRDGVSPRFGLIAPAMALLIIADDIRTGITIGLSVASIVGSALMGMLLVAFIFAVVHIRTGEGRFCVRCDYPAEGLGGARACPECGLDWRHPGALRHGAPWRFRERWIAVWALMLVSLGFSIVRRF